MKNALLYMLFLLVSTDVFSQDPIFTQYFMVPQTINPAFTAFTETTSAGALHRSQWPDAKLKINSDYAFFNTWSEKMNSGLGINLLSQRESFTDYSLTQVNFAYTYRVQISDFWYFHPALEIGIGNKSFGFQNLILEDQLNINTGIINPISIDPLNANERVRYLDIGAGFLFNNEDSWIGVSLRHLNKPNISFVQAGNVPLDMFFSLNAGYQFRVADYFDTFLPHDSKLSFSGNYMQQSRYNRFDLSMGLVLKQMFFGVIAVTNPAKNSGKGSLLTSVNPYLGLQYENFKVGYSYDAMTNGMNRTGGIHEFSLIFVFDWDKECLGCPQYYIN